MASKKSVTRKHRSPRVSRSLRGILPPLDWRPLSFLGAWIRRPDGRKLFVYVASENGEWIALAVEGPDVGDPRAVLEDHGHRMIGQFVKAAAAQRAAEGFAQKWSRGRARIEECACDEVAG